MTSPGQPIFHTQFRHMLEVHRVSRKQRGAMSQCDAGDFQVHCTDTQALGPQLNVHIRCSPIPRQDEARSKECDSTLEPLVQRDLPMRVPLPLDLREPTAELLLCALMMVVATSSSQPSSLALSAAPAAPARSSSHR